MMMLPPACGCCRERGVKALEERLGIKKAATASTAATTAEAAQEAAVTAPAAAEPDVEAGVVAVEAAS